MNSEDDISPNGSPRNSAKPVGIIQRLADLAPAVAHAVERDLVERRGDRIYFAGRQSGSINVGGSKVYPEEVEETVKLHEAVTDCVVVGVPDDKWGQAITAVVSVDGDSGAASSEIIALAKKKLAAYKAPKHIVVVDRVVRSPAGKADYRWALDAAKRRLSID